jgi:hypothetical protein
MVRALNQKKRPFFLILDIFQNDKNDNKNDKNDNDLKLSLKW